MPIRRQRSAVETPPKAFPVVIKPHAYDESGLSTCLVCGQKKDARLHIRSHFFEKNLDSKLGKCMCGKAESDPIHRKG